MNHINSPQPQPRKQVDLAYSVTAERLYEVYAQFGQLFKGETVPWESLDSEHQAAWIAVAKAI